MTLFEKCAAYTLPGEVQAMGIYPYFTPIEETTATEARIRGEWKIMVGSNNYLHSKITNPSELLVNSNWGLVIEGLNHSNS